MPNHDTVRIAQSLSASVRSLPLPLPAAIAPECCARRTLLTAHPKHRAWEAIAEMAIRRNPFDVAQ